MENAVVLSTGRRVPQYLKGRSFFDECLMGICTVGIVCCSISGIVSCFSGSQKNSELLRIREQGTRLTAQVVSCRMNTVYSTLSVPMYTYHVEFEMDGEERKSTTISSVYTPAGSAVEIYYLPYRHGEVGGSVLADINDSPGKVKIHYGILELLCAYLLYAIRVIIKTKNR